jgi:hypothetical protein
VRNEALWLSVPPTLLFVLETSEWIVINLLEKKTAMDFLKCKEKLHEEVKIAKVSVPFYAAYINAMCFKYGKLGHLGRECKGGKTATL